MSWMAFHWGMARERAVHATPVLSYSLSNPYKWHEYLVYVHVYGAILDSEVSDACDKSGIAYGTATIFCRLSDWTPLHTRQYSKMKC